MRPGEVGITNHDRFGGIVYVIGTCKSDLAKVLTADRLYGMLSFIESMERPHEVMMEALLNEEKRRDSLQGEDNANNKDDAEDVNKAEGAQKSKPREAYDATLAERATKYKNGKWQDPEDGLVESMYNDDAKICDGETSVGVIDFRVAPEGGHIGGEQGKFVGAEQAEAFSLGW